MGRNSELANLIKSGRKAISLPTENYRFGVRAIAASTNERALICSILPQNVCVGNSLFTALPWEYFESARKIEGNEKDWKRANYSYSQLAFSVGFLNSLCVDWLVRMKVSTNLNVFILNQLPLPRLNENDHIYQSIIARVTRLVCTTSEFSDFWNAVFDKKWSDPEFWYPNSLSQYGPEHEHRIRIEVRDLTHQLTKTWNKKSGVHGRTSDRRDTGDRAQLRAEIDAYVAHLFNLTREEFAYVLNKFPVLRRKDEGEFGEFVTERKCIEEYDRIGKIV